MALVDDLLEEGVDADAVEQLAASGGLPPAGKYHAVLDGVREVEANSGSVGRELVFKLIGGPCVGYEVKETVWKPDASQEEAKRAKTKARLYSFLHRLKVLNKVEKAGGGHTYEKNAGRSDFMDAIGQECVVEVKHEEEVWADKKTGAARKMMKANLTYYGLFAIDDPAVKDVPRGKSPAGAGAGAAGAGNGPPPAAKPAKDMFGDL